MSHRRALDHVLALAAGAPVGESLVLRGSMAMLAWVGDRARPPGDLDWVVRPIAGVPRDDLSPYPFIDRIDEVQSAPETAHGAGRYNMWDFEEFETGGLAPRLPPEGLRWVEAEELREDERPHQQLLDLVRDRPRTEDGLVFDPDTATFDATFGYDYEWGADVGSGGARVTLPWRDGDEQGRVQLDFAYDETLPDPPTFVAVPRADGGPPTVAWAASRELSLVWKVRWLATDQARDGYLSGKDLYDAVLLAELDGVRLPDRLRRDLARQVPDPDAALGWVVDWSGVVLPETAVRAGLHDRLAAALHRLYAA